MAYMSLNTFIKPDAELLCTARCVFSFDEYLVSRVDLGCVSIGYKQYVDIGEI